MRENLNVLLIFTSPMAKDGQHLFMYFSFICISLFEKCLFRSFAQLLIGLFVILVFHFFLSSLYILNVNFLSHEYLAKVFSHPIDYLFILLIFLLLCKSIFNLI
jgi:hypothetical protein